MKGEPCSEAGFFVFGAHFILFAHSKNGKQKNNSILALNFLVEVK